MIKYTLVGALCASLSGASYTPTESTPECEIPEEIDAVCVRVGTWKGNRSYQCVDRERRVFAVLVPYGPQA